MPSELPARLAAWARAAAAAAEDPTRAAIVVEDAHNIVRRVRTTLLSRCNEYYCLLLLPPALLLQICCSSRPRDVWSLSQTCRHLRQSCLAAPALWQTLPPAYYRKLPWSICAYPRPSFDIFSTLASLSYLNPPCDEAVVSLLVHRLPELQRLSVAPPSQESCAKLLQILRAGAPRMHVLQITCYMIGERGCDLPCDLLGGAAGALHTLTLSHFSLLTETSRYPAFRNVRSFSWDTIELDALSFGRILALMPRLTTLQLVVDRFTWDARAIELQRPRALNRFTLFARCSANVFACVRRLGLPRFKFVASFGYEDFLDELVRQRLSSVRLGISISEVVVTECASGQPLTVSGLMDMILETHSDVGRQHLAPRLYGLLTQLSIHEFYWPAADVPALPSLSALRALRITLASCANYRTAWQWSFGILAGFDLAWWDAPALETLHIAYCPPAMSCRRLAAMRDLPAKACSCAASLPISLMDVHEFVTICLPVSPRDRRLTQFKVSGVEIVDNDPWPAYSLLQEMSDEFSISYTPLLTPFDVDDRERAADEAEF